MRNSILSFSCALGLALLGMGGSAFAQLTTTRTGPNGNTHTTSTTASDGQVTTTHTSPNGNTHTTSTTASDGQVTTTRTGPNGRSQTTTHTVN